MNFNLYKNADLYERQGNPTYICNKEYLDFTILLIILFSDKKIKVILI